MFPQLFGKYVLERELASGGMAIVYLATLRGAGGFEKRLVVKQIRAELASDDAFVTRFVAEAKTTVGLSHPNIVPVYELGVEHGVYYIAMELAPGVTLAEMVKVVGALSPEEGAYLGVEVCRALDYAHRRAGVVHRDVTPRNVLIDEEGAVRVIDFGIAAPVSVEGGARERVFGSPGHMPPEQLRGGRLSPATDVFAVGALLVEGWTARAPFRRATRAESDAALEAEYQPLSGTDERLRPLDDLMRRALSLDAKERPQTAEDLARPLRDFLKTQDLGDLARRLGARVRRVRRARGSITDESIADGERDAVPPVTGPFGAGTGRPGSLPPTPVTPVTRPISQSGTETFASRDEVVEWTRGASVPPPPEETLALDEPAESTPESLEKPQGATAVAPLPPPRPARRALWLALAMLGGAAVAAITSRPGPGGSTPDAPQAVASSRSASSPTPVVTGSVPVASAMDVRGPDAPSAPAATIPPEVRKAAPNGTSTALAGAPPATDVASTAPAPAASDEAGQRSALFNVTSDLPARVTIDGVSQGATPLHGARRPAGHHVVAVVSAELGERLAATIDARPGQVVAVHAEFTRPVPAIRVR